MIKLKRGVMFILLVLLLIGSVYAITPQNDFDFRSVFNIYNVNIFNASTGSIAGSPICTLATGCGSVGKKGDGIYLYNDSTTMYLNETKLNATIDNKIVGISRTYLPTSFSVDTGTLDSGNLESLKYADGDSLNISEVSGVPGFIIRINYTNVSSFNIIQIYQYYDGSQGHSIHIELWNYDLSAWISFGSFSDEGGFVFLSEPILNDSKYVQGNNVQLRLHHDDSGHPNHDIFIDEAILKFSSFGGGGVQGGGIVGYLPRWLDSSSIGDSIISQNGTNITINGGNVAANLFYGNGSQLTGITHTVDTNCSVTGACSNIVYTNNISNYYNKTETNTQIQNANSSMRNYADETFNRNSTDANFTNLWVTGTSYLGSIIINAENLTVDNLVPLTGNNINIFGNLTSMGYWFNGLFNWTDDSKYLSFDGTILSFDESELNNTIETIGNETYVNIDGDTMTGSLNVSNNIIYVSDDTPIIFGNSQNGSIYWNSTASALTIRVN